MSNCRPIHGFVYKGKFSDMKKLFRHLVKNKFKEIRYGFSGKGFMICRYIFFNKMVIFAAAYFKRCFKNEK